MTEKQFSKLIDEIQVFMGLDNWYIHYAIDNIPVSDDGKQANAQMDKILYDYFNVAFTFDKSILDYKYEEDIIHIIFHEFSHIYTSNTLEPYCEEREFLAHHIGESAFVELKNKFVFINEQQTELIARRFKKLYLALKK